MMYQFDGKMYTLVQDFKVPVFRFNGKLTFLTIPKGFSWDGMSAPKGVRALFDDTESGSLEASCAHDFCYKFKVYSRSNCDEMFFQLLLFYGYTVQKARIAYWTVRLFGSSHYGRN